MTIGAFRLEAFPPLAVPACVIGEDSAFLNDAAFLFRQMGEIEQAPIFQQDIRTLE
jgi:hypothetical protein